MTRARILADYVATGVTATEFDFLDTTSGTPGATTFLRGDKTWQTAGSTSASDLDSGTLGIARLPAGTILQTVVNTKSDEYSNAHTSTTFARAEDASANKEWNCEISGLQANSDVFMIASFGFNFYRGGGYTSTGGGFGFFRDTTAIATPRNVQFLSHGNTGDEYGQVTISYLDESPTGTSHTYYVGSISYAASHQTRIRSDTTGEGDIPFVMTLMEIARAS